MARFTVFGGTGFLGSRIVRHLVRDGHQVRVAARHPEHVAAAENITPVRADIRRPETLEPALDGAEGAVNAVSLYVEHGGTTFDAIHVEGAARLAEAAREAGLSRYVHVSGIGAEAGSSDAFIRSRGRGEAGVRVACPFATIVRPSVMVGEDDPLRATILGLTRFQPLFPLFGNGDTRLQPVHRDDVARAIARLLTGAQPRPIYEFGGPESYAYAELVHRVAEAGGRRFLTFPVPFALWHGLAALAERLPSAPLTRAQVALMRGGNTASPDLPGLTELGITPRDIIADLERRGRIDQPGPDETGR